MRIRDSKTTALIFASGKMVITGAKSEDNRVATGVTKVCAHCAEVQLGFDAKFAEFKIQNIVGSCGGKFPIHLKGLAYSHGQFNSYEPEVRCPSVRVSSTHIYSAVPRTHLSHAQTQSCTPDFCIGKDSVDRRKGTDIHYILSRR